jgi:hypothetical protein
MESVIALPMALVRVDFERAFVHQSHLNCRILGCVTVKKDFNLQGQSLLTFDIP